MAERGIRCSTCKKKTGLDYFVCKCDESKRYCSQHKFPFEHGCSLDIAKEHRESLAKKIVKVAPSKFREISE
jgi:hypothetical protein